jgi:tetratricopeptide (TPR) repeat protein
VGGDDHGGGEFMGREVGARLDPRRLVDRAQLGNRDLLADERGGQRGCTPAWYERPARAGLILEDNRGVLPDNLFRPLDLDAALDEAFERGGTDAVFELLAQALLDPRARGDEALGDYLQAFGEVYTESDKGAAAVPVLERLVELEPDHRDRLVCDLADLHAQTGDHERALALLKSRHGELSLLAPEKRDLGFYQSAALTAGEIIGDRGLARRWIDECARLALDRRETPERVLWINTLRTMFAATDTGEKDPELDTRIDRYLKEGLRRATPPAPRPQRVHLRMAYLPADAYAEAAARGLLDPTFPTDHTDYRRDVEEVVRSWAGQGKLSVVHLDIPGLLDFAAREGKDPARRGTRLDYCNTLDEHRGVAWPPQRNSPCWCGSGRKYKKCCGAPGFLDHEVPDRGSAVLRVELEHAEPPVWRRVAVPFRIRFDRLHEVLHETMGWTGDHMYAFERDDEEVLDPRAQDPDAWRADEERLSLLANEQGMTFVYRYDFGDDWTHKVTVEQITEVDPADNQVRLLDGSGACPPEDCGGIIGYRALLAALGDPAHPRHAEAAKTLGASYDPATWTSAH